MLIISYVCCIDRDVNNNLKKQLPENIARAHCDN